MAYNFYQQQKNVSQSFNNQVSSLAENIEAEGRQQVENRNQQLQSLSQEVSIEGAEEKAQSSQLKAAGVGSIVEGSVVGIPAIKTALGVVKKGYQAFSKAQQVVENVNEGVNNVKQSVSNMTDTLQSKMPIETSGTSSTATDVRNVQFDNPLYESNLSAVNEVKPEQFGDDIDMTGRQLSSEATPVLPTTQLETPTTGVANAKTVIGDVPEGTELLGDTTTSIQTIAPKIVAGAAETEGVAEAKGIFGGIFGDILGGIGDIFDPIVAVASAAAGVYGIVKGVEDEKAKPEQPTLSQPPALPDLQVLGDVQSSAQVGI